MRSVGQQKNGRDWSRPFAKESQKSVGPIRRTVHTKQTEVVLPEPLKPHPPLLEESSGSTQFYVLDETTGVLVMGDFDGDKEDNMKCTLHRGLQKMHDMGVQKLVIDLVSPTFFIVTGEILIDILDRQSWW